LALFIAKELMPLSFVEVPFFQRLVLRQNPHFNFPSRWVLINEILPKIIEKTKEKYIYLTLESCNTCMISFDLWMSRAIVDTFVLIVHFLNDKWEPCHVTIGFFWDSWDFWECHVFASQWSPYKEMAKNEEEREFRVWTKWHPGYTKIWPWRQK